MDDSSHSPDAEDVKSDVEESNSGWDRLAEEIGATPPPDALERKHSTTSSESKPTRRSQRPTPPPPPRGDWNALASELGIKTPEPVSSPAPPEAAAQPDAKRSSPRAADSPPSSGAGRGKAKHSAKSPKQKSPEDAVQGGSDGSLFDDIPSLGGDGGGWLAEAPRHEDDLDDDAGDPSKPESSQPDASESAEAAASPSDDENQASLEAEAPAELREGDEEGEDASLSGDAARSAFDALFESGSFASMEVPVPGLTDKDRQDDAAAADLPSGAADSTEATPPKKRGGWFGFGRGRQQSAEESESTEAKSEPPSDEASDEPEDWLGKSATDSAEMSPETGEDEDSGGASSEGGEKPGRRRRRRRRRRPAAKGEPTREGTTDSSENGSLPGGEADLDVDGADMLDDEAAPEADQGGGRRRPVHRNIPTWADAIDVMVEANMQQRKQSRERSASSRGGSGKGRSRGGSRRRKKS